MPTINWDVVDTFARSTKYQKKPSAKKFNPNKKTELPDDVLAAKNKQRQRYRAAQKAKDKKADEFAREYPNFGLWRKMLQDEVAAKSVNVDDWGMLDAEFITLAEDLELRSLPMEVREHCQREFGKLVRDAHDRADWDAMPLFEPPPYPVTATDYDEMWTFLKFPVDGTTKFH